MGSGKKVGSDEAYAIALAYVRTTEDPRLGADRKGSDFQAQVFATLKELSPVDPPDGTYWHRDEANITRISRNIRKDVALFNKALNFVKASQPTGVDAQQIVNLAVARHLKKMDEVDYQFKNFDANKWAYYKAWTKLRFLDKYAEPVVDEELARDRLASIPASVSIATRTYGSADDASTLDGSDESPNAGVTTFSVANQTVSSAPSSAVFSNAPSSTIDLAANSRGHASIGNKASKKAEAIKRQREKEKAMAEKRVKELALFRDDIKTYFNRIQSGQRNLSKRMRFKLKKKSLEGLIANRADGDPTKQLYMYQLDKLLKAGAAGHYDDSSDSDNDS